MRPKKKVRMEDIAGAMGVSVVTVSNALSGRKGVSREMREKIMRKAEELGYSAGSPVKKDGVPEGRIMILVCKENENPSLPAEAAGYRPAPGADSRPGETEGLPAPSDLIRAARRNNFSAVVHELNPGTALLPFDTDETDGIIFLGRPGAEVMERTEAHGLPAVGCGFFDLHVPMDYIVDASYHNMMALVRYLAGLGHRKITFAAKRPEASASIDKMLGFWASMVRMGLADFDDQTAIEDVSGYTPERAAGCAVRGEVTAIVCADAKTQREVMRLLGEYGLRIPKDISVAVCGSASNIKEEAEVFTACLPDIHEIAEQTVHFISRQIRKGTAPSGVHVVPGVLHAGKTAGLCWNGRVTDAQIMETEKDARCYPQ